MVFQTRSGVVGNSIRSTPNSASASTTAFATAASPGVMPPSLPPRIPSGFVVDGTSLLDRLDENLGAVAIELASDDLCEIDTAISNIRVQGARGTGHERYV
jgi:hypothetical protein